VNRTDFVKVMHDKTFNELNDYAYACHTRGKVDVFWRPVPCCDAIKSIAESTRYPVSSWWYDLRGQGAKGSDLSPSMTSMCVKHF